MRKKDVAEELKGKVTFTQHLLPSLESGKYHISLQQTVKIDKKNVNDIFKVENTFAVVTERNKINPAEIHSVFPADNSVGDFQQTLPHIVLTRSTFPWERIVANNIPEESSRDKASWLALLLFTEEEAVSELNTIKLGDLFTKRVNAQSNLPDDTLSYFDSLSTFEEIGKCLEYGETLDDDSQAIDIPVDLVNSLIPSISDLKKLAHLRTVNLIKKEVTKKNNLSGEGIDEEADFSVIIGNRLPQMNQRNTVYLVSLENFGAFLPDENYNSRIPQNKKNIRLLFLKKWSFTVVKEEINFLSVLKNLNQNPITFKMPENPMITNETLKKAFAFGFCPLPHHSRSGDKTFSWYRGPLVPYQIKKFITPPFPCSDALTLYNPKTGLLNTSYSTAWQLGRLMALSTKSFSQTLYNWKKKLKQNAYHLSACKKLLTNTVAQKNHLNSTNLLTKKNYLSIIMDDFKQNMSAFLNQKKVKKK